MLSFPFSPISLRFPNRRYRRPTTFDTTSRLMLPRSSLENVSAEREITARSYSASAIRHSYFWRARLHKDLSAFHDTAYTPNSRVCRTINAIYTRFVMTDWPLVGDEHRFLTSSPYLIEARGIRDLGGFHFFFSGAHTAEKSLNERDESPNGFFAPDTRVVAIYALAIARLTIARRRRRGATAATASDEDRLLYARVTMITMSVSMGNSFALYYSCHEDGAPCRAWIRTLRDIVNCLVLPEVETAGTELPVQKAIKIICPQLETVRQEDNSNFRVHAHTFLIATIKSCIKVNVAD